MCVYVCVPDYDECLTEKACVDGVCVNTAGSFDCFCSPPLVLDTTRRRCVSVNTTEGETHTLLQTSSISEFIQMKQLPARLLIHLSNINNKELVKTPSFPLL